MKIAEQIGQISRALTRRVTRKAAQASSRSFQQLRALRAIDREQIHTQVALAERLLIDAPAASRLVDRLEEDGLLQRKPGENRRCVCLQLTKKARREIAVINGAVEEVEAELREHLTEKEAETLLKILAKLNHRLAEPISEK